MRGFSARDPLDGVDGTPTTANPYHYADNDPLNKTDPTGLRPGDSDLKFDDPCFREIGVPGTLRGSVNDGPVGCYVLEVTGYEAGPMNAAEVAHCSNPLNVKSCHEAQTAADKARAEAARRFSGTDQDYYANGYGMNYTASSDGGANYVGSDVKGAPRDGSMGNAYQHIVWNGLMTRMMGKDSAKGFADRHETDAVGSTDWLYFRGMDFANNFYGREIASRMSATMNNDFEQAFFDRAERFVRDGGSAGSACWIRNYPVARPYKPDGEAPAYADRSRCGAG